MRKLLDTSKPTIAMKRFEVFRMADMLEQAYLDSRREPNDNAKISFAPSGIGYGSGTCPRRWFYDLSGGVMREDEPDAIGIANMAYGTEAHERLQGLFKQADILVEAERKVVTEPDDKTPPVYGYADLIVDWQGEEVVGEIKTTSQESFVSKKSKNQPAGYHLLQVLIYMKALGLNKGFILYENKNNQEMFIVPVVWNVANKELIDQTWQWMLDVYANYKEGLLPTRPFKSDRSVVCRTCPFRAHCWEDDDGVVDLRILDVPK